MAEKKLRVGLDFDGVVAYNPVRVIRPAVKWFKRIVLGKKNLSFMVPRNPLVKLLWIVAHESSIFPAKGIRLLQEMAKRGDVEFYLVTGRFPILEGNLKKWIARNKLAHVFEQIYLNNNLEQPHLFKLKIINKLKLDYYVEDNFDIVEYLEGKVKAKIFWIYNVADRKRPFKYKFPYLEEALDEIKK